MALDGVRGNVTQGVVRGLLLARQSDLLDSGRKAEFEARVMGAAVAVVLLVGDDPEPGFVRDLAIETIATEVASQIEYAEYPEQQAAGDIGRGYHLHQRYLELLALLRSYIQAESVGGVAGAVPSPVGSFPAARVYPQPIETASAYEV